MLFKFNSPNSTAKLQGTKFRLNIRDPRKSKQLRISQSHCAPLLMWCWYRKFVSSWLMIPAALTAVFILQNEVAFCNIVLMRCHQGLLSLTIVWQTLYLTDSNNSWLAILLPNHFTQISFTRHKWTVYNLIVTKLYLRLGAHPVFWVLFLGSTNFKLNSVVVFSLVPLKQKRLGWVFPWTSPNFSDFYELTSHHTAEFTKT